MITVTGSKFSTVSSEKNERRCMSNVIRLYPLTNYSVQNNDYEDPPRIFDYKQSLKLRQQYENNGMIRTVQGVLLGHQNSIIHVLLLKNGIGQMQSSKLPEVTLYNSEDEIDGMKRLMAEVMGFKDTAEAVCQIQHVAAKWWLIMDILLQVCHMFLADLTTSTIPDAGFDNKPSMSKKYVITRTNHPIPLKVSFASPYFIRIFKIYQWKISDFLKTEEKINIKQHHIPLISHGYY
uniref:Cleavage and polyadenylation specificity factor subunit 5 n=1 Tax=Wuchereria bancrofti TaxID=6293 RepID=A0A1I8EB22_WUCBA